MTFQGHDFFEVIYCLDKVQLKHKKNLMGSPMVAQALHYFKLAEPVAKKVWVEAVTTHSVAGYEFKRRCAKLVINNDGGYIAWGDAPDAPYGQGSHYTISCIEPLLAAQHIVKLFQGFTEEKTLDEGHLIFKGGVMYNQYTSLFSLTS
jgi:hypothetical protein